MTSPECIACGAPGVEPLCPECAAHNVQVVRCRECCGWVLDRDARGDDGDLCEDCARPLTRAEIRRRKEEERHPRCMGWLLLLIPQALLEVLR